MTRKQKVAYDKKWKKEYKKRTGVAYGTNWIRHHPQYVFSLKYLYGVLRRNAETRGLTLSISLDQYTELRGFSCHYCGGKLPFSGHGLDRIDNSVGYTLSNVRPCCTQCNGAKSDMTEEDFKNWILRVTKRWFKT